ncbi:hypothetical protein K435DRAFT_208538 [Dendrothele bispora CBS 962.96]|uniref:Uncharacterized protein n=1 Tax=Dendrothele bispora (strain CBS 962.96) TaxID=1314807 RepID=A0A4S8LSV4_DENBC|nr:hypothetical protein K435DRAFT_208538 [Dendrothele bispora CBS 962.96]
MPRTLLCTTCHKELLTSDIPPDSPFRDVLHSSRVPSESDIPRIKQVLAESLVDLAKYDAHIEGLMGIVAELQQKRADLKKYVDEHRNLLSSMRRFPSEILGEIFDFCCSKHGLSVYGTTLLGDFQVNAPTLHLSQTCSRWRDVAISSPSLWSQMTVNFTYPRVCRAKPLIELYLFRSKSAPLSLRLASFGTPSGGPEDTEHLYAISVLSLLLSAAERWEHVDLDTSHYVDFNLFPDSRVIPPNCPLLKSLKLTLNANWNFRAEDQLWLESLVENANSLRKLTLSDLDTDIQTSFKNNRITSLQLYDNDHGFLLGFVEDVFRLFPHLQHLDITLGEPRVAELFSNQTSELRSTILKSLTVRIASWDLRWISHVLSSLQLPSLVSLELLVKRGLDIDIDSLMPSLETMFRQSSPSLHSFKIDSGHSLTSIQLSDILSWMPLLTYLSINVIPTILHEGVLAQLTYIPGFNYPTYASENSTSSVLLPRLKSMEISINFETNVEEFLPDMDSIIAMIESRIPHPSSADNGHYDSLVDKLSHLTVLIPYFRDNSERAWAEEFRAVLKKRLQKHMNQGFTCTVTLGEASSSCS